MSGFESSLSGLLFFCFKRSLISIQNISHWKLAITHKHTFNELWVLLIAGKRFLVEFLIISVHEIREHMSGAPLHYITLLSSSMICCYSCTTRKTENGVIYEDFSKCFPFRYIYSRVTISLDRLVVELYIELNLDAGYCIPVLQPAKNSSPYCGWKRWLKSCYWMNCTEQ